MPTLTSSTDAVFLHDDDNLCIAVRDLPVGATVAVAGGAVRLAAPVALGHKIATRGIDVGQRIVKFGQTIGFATMRIEPGDWVHTHNIAAGEFARDYEYATEIPPAPAPITGRTFMGYRRADGRAATRNYIAVISTVNCSAGVSKAIARHFDRDRLAAFPNVDGVIALTHATGCGMAIDLLHHQMLDRVMGGFARHANIAGVLIIGLGCEVATPGHLIKSEGLATGARGQGKAAIPLPLGPSPSSLGPALVLSMQDLGGTRKTIDRGIALVTEMLPRLSNIRRVPIPAGEIILGLKCGGSDGNSGITANPALGIASDRLIAAGGTAVLAETTEVYGAEHLLTRRARTEAVGRKLIERIHWWEWYAKVFGASIDNNPSPGNKAGGLTTIYEKSLGAVAKAGSTALNAVYEYAMPIREKGFVLMDTPGFDPVCVTGMVAGGANVVCFTTGRGSCFGCKPTPSIKIATNTPMYERMIDDMDFNAGTILQGATVAEVGEAIFDLVLDVAGGKKTKSEVLGAGDEEFTPWHLGPVL
jgi:altronate hydrolase